MFFLNRTEVPYLAPASIENMAKTKIIAKVAHGSCTFIGSSTMMWKIAIESTETMIPQTYPRVIAASVVAISSYTITAVIYLLVHPIDLSTPSSHIESLILAETVTTSWKAPRMRQTTEVRVCRKRTKVFLSSSSSY